VPKEEEENYLSQNEPVISVDTKKKELIGNFKNPGVEWCQKEEPVEVLMHDFVDPKLGKAIPGERKKVWEGKSKLAYCLR
jgi:hypothetical protein